MDYYGNNDWWDYIEHGWFGSSQKDSAKGNHKYYMRVSAGTKNGKNIYRYFYSKADYEAYIRSGKKKLTGAYRLEHHPNGRTAHVATEQYDDMDGQTKLRKKYISAEEADKLLDDKYRRERALKETPKEKKKRMKQAKKRYNKKMSATRRKIAVQKGMQTVARFMGKQMDFKKKPSDKTEKKAYREAGWHKSLFVPGAYTRKAK